MEEYEVNLDLNIMELHKVNFQPFIMKIHKGMMEELISYIWISELLFHKDKARINQRTAEKPCWHSVNALTGFFLQCSSMCYLCHAETCIKMKCHTSLPFQSVVQFIFLSSDRVHKFNNYILSCSLYSLSASYSVFSLSLQACRKCLILGFLWRHNRQEKQNKMLSII